MKRVKMYFAGDFDNADSKKVYSSGYDFKFALWSFKNCQIRNIWAFTKYRVKQQIVKKKNV